MCLRQVLNHTSDEHYWFVEARKSKDNPYRDYYVWSDTDQKYAEARIIFIDTEPSNWTYDETTGEYYWHRFYASQPRSGHALDAERVISEPFASEDAHSSVRR